jgi:hypothetical protein
MLISLIILLAAMLSWLSSIVSQIAGPLRKPPITPQDPSTLTLTLIGLGTLCVYFVISRRAWRRRAESNWTGRLSDQSVEAAATPDESKERMPSRGAA